MKRLPAFFLFAIPAFCAPPVLYYSDLASGPNTGGRNNHGAVVCISGTRLGATRGMSAVTVGGGAAAEYLLWSDSKVCFALGEATTTGNIVATVDGADSNPLPFTVRSASIFYAGNTSDIGGSPGTPLDTNSGDFNHPVATIRACKSKLASGSGAICYVRGTVSPQTGIESVSAAVVLSASGTSSAPLTIAAWPGDAMPIVGQYNDSAQTRGFYPYPSGDHWVIAGFWIRAYTSAIQLTPVPTDFRIVGNKMECPAGDGGTACLIAGFSGNNPSQSQSYKVFGNEITNVGCGEGATSGPDNSAGLAGQTLQYPCNAVGVQAGTVSMSGGNTLTISGATFGYKTSLYPGIHILVDTDGDGTFEDSVLSSVTSTTATLYSNSFVNTTFTGATWKYRPFTSSKLYHSTYFGTDTNGIDFGWNWLHSNTAQHGYNSHSTAASGASQIITSIATGSPARMTLSAPFALLANGQRLDIVGNSRLPDGVYYVSLPVPGNYSDVDLFTDSALTKAVVLASTGTGGKAARSGFGMFNAAVHDNLIHDQNGACVSIASADPDRGAISIYNNVLHDCGTGPITAVGGMALPGFYMLNTPDDPTRNLWGTGTVEVYNNTVYNVSKYSAPPAGSTIGAICMNTTPKALYFRARNNIFHQPNGLPFTTCPNADKITGSNNIWFGTSSSTIPGNVSANLTKNPTFAGLATMDFHLTPESPAKDAGVAIPGLATDRDGVIRPQGKAYDIGAYELAAPATEPTANLIAFTRTPTTAVLRWSAASGPVTGYRVERRPQGGSYSTLVDLAPEAVSFTDSGLTSGNEYCYRVLVADGAMLSQPSNQACAVPGAGAPLLSPLHVTGNVAVLAIRKPDSSACVLSLNGLQSVESVSRISYVTLTGLAPQSVYDYTLTCGERSDAGTITTGTLTEGTRTLLLKTSPPSPLAADTVKVFYGPSSGALSSQANGVCAPQCVASLPIAANVLHWLQYEYWRAGTRVASSQVTPLAVR